MLAGEDGGSTLLDVGGSEMSGPPHTDTILVSKPNAVRAVARSDGSRAKCSMLAMTDSKMSWFAIMYCQLNVSPVTELMQNTYSC